MSIIQKAEDFVNQLFKDNLSLDYTYHNFNHTLGVVESTKVLLSAENCSPEEIEIALLAAWFHDTGYIKGCEKHEDSSIEIAIKFLKEQQYDTSKIEIISQLIRKTELHQVPNTKLEKIIRDADWAHFGNPDYFKYCNLLRYEFNTTRKLKFNDLEWSYENLKFFENSHRYYTDYAKKNWQPIKEENEIQLKKSIAILEEKKQKKKSIKSLLTKKKLEKMDVPERGIDTMFRVTLNNHTKLSQIADSKANILLSVNAIIISIALST